MKYVVQRFIKANKSDKVHWITTENGSHAFIGGDGKPKYTAESISNEIDEKANKIDYDKKVTEFIDGIKKYFKGLVTVYVSKDKDGVTVRVKLDNSKTQQDYNRTTSIGDFFPLYKSDPDYYEHTSRNGSNFYKDSINNITRSLWDSLLSYKIITLENKKINELLEKYPLTPKVDIGGELKQKLDYQLDYIKKIKEKNQ